jgi:hypothetical protein
VVFGMIRPEGPKYVKYAPPPRNHPHNHLDTVDQMVLYGEVTNDSFYDVI